MILAGAEKAQDKYAVCVQTIEDTVAPIRAAPDAVALVSGNQGISLWKITKATGDFSQFFDKADGPLRIVRFNMPCNARKIFQRA